MISMNPLDRVGLPLALGNEVPQAGIYVHAPSVRANVVAFVGRRQTNVRKAKFGFAVLLADFKSNVGTSPLRFVLNEVEIVAQHVPYDFFARHKFGDFECATMKVLGVIEKYRAEFVGVALDSF